MSSADNPNDSWVRTIQLSPPSLRDNTADADRVLGVLRRELKTTDIHIDFRLLGRLSGILRQSAYRVRCVLLKDGGQWRLIGILGADSAEKTLGLAVDLGTTRIVIRLLDLFSGASYGETAFDNPQIEIGPDVLTRIHFADQPDGLSILQNRVVKALNQELVRLCAAAGLSPDAVYLFSVAGNTAMTHLFLGLDPRWIIREPYIPVVNTPDSIAASALGLIGDASARVIALPNVGSYFGGDLIAGLLYSGLHRRDETAILVDVGTNAEVVLGNRHWLMACAGAAGPALEGGVTKMGMMAGPGVIDQVEIDFKTGEFRIHTIENQPPRGICGSGLIDLAAQLFLSGMIDIRGKLQPEKGRGRIFDKDGMSHLIVVPAAEAAKREDLTIGQADLDSLVRSKAAMFTILETITEAVGVTFHDLAKFYVAGTFGSFIRPSSAITIGMLPDLPLHTYTALGNSSLAGAALLLTDARRIDEIRAIRDRITYMELNVNQDFMNRFSAAKFFPHTDPHRFPTVAVWLADRAH